MIHKVIRSQRIIIHSSCIYETFHDKKDQYNNCLHFLKDLKNIKRFEDIYLPSFPKRPMKLKTSKEL